MRIDVHRNQIKNKDFLFNLFNDLGSDIVFVGYGMTPVNMAKMQIKTLCRYFQIFP